MTCNLIAFCGYGGAGKDMAALPLLDAGYQRRCFGDTIKSQVDSLIQTHLGFSAFTENREQKAKIRRTLESWGEDNYQNILHDFFANLPPRCVNTRLCRIAEAEMWIARGGLIFEIRRPNIFPETEWARDRMTELRRAGVIHSVVENSGDLPKLHQTIIELFDLNDDLARHAQAA